MSELDWSFLALLSLYFFVYFINKKHNDTKEIIKSLSECPPHQWSYSDQVLQCKVCKGVITENGEIYHV